MLDADIDIALNRITIFINEIGPGYETDRDIVSANEYYKKLVDIKNQLV
jgi:hypothetical protein